MRGGHCIKTWSKTQAIIAKSSAEAEFYGVVRGATEAIGMSTLFADMGLKVSIQMHLDSAAAKGIIERKGLSKVRHIDVNVLWLQETCARKLIPLNKVPGETNPADLMTKHLAKDKIDQNVRRMRLEFEQGRSEKAAQLHLLQNQEEWRNIRKTGQEKKGGDRWQVRGEDGIWCRSHTTPRVSLFTPYKVARGPESRLAMTYQRYTYGVTESARKFEMCDDWTVPDRRYLVLEEPWIGHTIFHERSRAKDKKILEKGDFRALMSKEARRGRTAWSDIEDYDVGEPVRDL